MTDTALVRKKLAFIQTCISELKRLALPEELRHNLKERRFVEHTLQICIQAILDIASHIVSDERLGEPATNADLFSLLKTNDWITDELAEVLRAAAGFRNVIVHGYADVDLDILEDVIKNRLIELEDFTLQIASHLPE